MNAINDRLVIFRGPSKLGEQLANDMIDLALEYRFQPTILSQPSIIEYFQTCVSAAAVIVDVSIENGDSSIYESISVQPNLLDHVLFVSRTYLPLNFTPSIRGGTPAYPYPDLEKLSPGIQKLFENVRWSNAEILNWLREQLKCLKRPPHSKRLSQSEFESLPLDGAPWRKMLEENMERLKKRSLSVPKTFISYRGTYIKQVREFKRMLEQRSPERQIRVVEPGEFAFETELLSAARIWMVMGQLDDEIRECDDLIVYESEDYLASWWTRAELFAAAYITGGGGNWIRRDPKVGIRVYSPKTGAFRKADRKYTYNISLTQRRRVARIIANTRPDTIGPESNWSIKLQRWISRFGLDKHYLKFIQKTVKIKGIDDMIANSTPEEVLGSERVSDIMNELTLDSYRSFIWDHVFDKEFWRDFGRISIEASAPIDTDNFISAPESMERLNLSQVEDAAKRDGIVSIGGQKRRITRLPPRYLWHAPTFLRGKLQSLPSYGVRK